MKSVIFDFDGVIHDTFEIAHNLNQIANNKKIGIEEYKDIFNGNIYEDKRVSSYSKFFELQDEIFEKLIIEEEIKQELIKLKDYRLFIISSNKEETLKKYFFNNDLNDLFTDILGFETHKSKEKKFEMLMNKYSMKKEDFVFVTDTLGDILEANKLGIRCIAVDFGFHERERLEKGKPLAIVSDFKEILPIIKDI